MSIPHFSALSQKRKLAFTQSPRNFTVQEKIDGSNFKFKNSDAFPWAMRKTNTGPIYKSPDEWGTDMWVTGFRAAHAAMIQLIESRDSVMCPLHHYGDSVMLEMEMLLAEAPNLIKYSDHLNYLVIYGPKCNAAFSCYTEAFLDDVPYTTDGVTIQRMSKKYLFQVENLAASQYIIDDVDNYSDLFSPDEMYEYILGHYVRKINSDYGDLKETTKVEGLVFKHKTEEWMFKIVDRDWFTETNKKNYAIRNKIFRSPRGFKNSIMDQYKAECDKGTNVAVAATRALNALDVLWKDYSCTGFMEYICHKETEHIHQCNLNAFASVRAELNKASAS